jgi:tryptophan 2,3-dioxygenase
VRGQVLDGRRTLDEAVAARPYARMSAAMERFETAVLKWRQSHFRVAMRMLGRRPGTGYTEGVPYLDQVRAIPVFAT